MRPEKLIAMGNQIAGFFRSYPPEEAASGIRQHLVAFWTPAMVSSLEESLAADTHAADALLVRAMQRG